VTNRRRGPRKLAPPTFCGSRRGGEPFGLRRGAYRRTRQRTSLECAEVGKVGELHVDHGGPAVHHDQVGVGDADGVGELRSRHRHDARRIPAECADMIRPGACLCRCMRCSSRTVLCALFALTTVFASGCAPRRVVVVQAAPAAPVVDEEADETAETDQEPPPPQAETPPPPPDATYVWISGRWRWYGGRWVWYGGRWTHGRPAHVWSPGHWERRGPHVHVYVHGHWHR
jgi:hypothetical protein